jgi:hypothetical protein
VIFGGKTYTAYMFDDIQYVIDEGVIKWIHSDSNELQLYTENILIIEDDKIVTKGDEFVYDIMDMNYYIPITKFRNNAKQKLWVTMESPYIQWSNE